MALLSNGLITLLAPLLLSASFVGLLTIVLKRRYQTADRSKQEALDLLERLRIYEMAFRHSDGHGRRLHQLLIPACESYFSGDEITSRTYLSIIAKTLGVKDKDNGWTAHPYPNFIEIARDEINLVEGDKPKEVKEIE